MTNNLRDYFFAHPVYTLYLIHTTSELSITHNLLQWPTMLTHHFCVQHCQPTTVRSYCIFQNYCILYTMFRKNIPDIFDCNFKTNYCIRFW